MLQELVLNGDNREIDGIMAHDCYIGDSYISNSGAWTNSVPTVKNNSYTDGRSSSTGNSTNNNQSQQHIYHK